MIPRQFINTKILFLFLSIPLFSQTPTKINVTGNKNFESNFYESIINSNLSLDNEGLQQKIISALSLNGYYHSTISFFQKDSANNFINFELDEGTPTYINKISFDRLQNYDSSYVVNHFSPIENKIFIESELESKISELLSNLENQGYPFSFFE